MGKPSRDKGRRGETEARLLLESRDYTVVDLASGLSTEDLFMVDHDNVKWAVEVKNTKVISLEHRKQAIEQGKKRKARWMLMSKITGTGCWLVQRQGMRPVIWGDFNDGLDT